MIKKIRKLMKICKKERLGRKTVLIPQTGKPGTAGKIRKGYALLTHFDKL